MDDRQFKHFLRVHARARVLTPEAEPLLRVIPLSAWVLEVGDRDGAKRIAMRPGISELIASCGVRGAARALNIPWVARKVPAAHCSANMAVAVWALDPSSFAQALPADPLRMPDWAEIVSRGVQWHCEAEALRWLAFHALELRDACGAEETFSVIDYLRTLEHLHRSTGVDRVIEDSRFWHLAGALDRRRLDPRALSDADHLAAREMAASIGVDLAAFERALRRVSRALRGDDWRADPRYAGVARIRYRFAEDLPRVVKGYDFLLLAARGQFEREGLTMKHCVADYWPHAVDGDCLIFSMVGPTIRPDGFARATLELDASGRVAQLRGPGNAAPGPGCLAAAVLFAREVRDTLLRRGCEGGALRAGFDLEREDAPSGEKQVPDYAPGPLIGRDVMPAAGPINAREGERR